MGIVIGVARLEECSGFGSLADNFLLFEHRQKSQEFPEIPCGQFRVNSFLRFLAKNSNARYTKSLRIKGIGRPHFLAKIPKVFANYLLHVICLRILMLATPNPFALRE